MRVVLGVFIVAAATVIAGCGGGGGGGTSAPAAVVPTAAPTSPVNTAPQAVSTSVSVSAVANGGSAAPFSVAAPTGYSQTAALPLTGHGTTLNIVNSISAVSSGGVPALSAARMSGASRASFSATRTTQADNFSAVFYTLFSPASTVTVAGQASLAVQFPSGVVSAGTAYYLAFYDPTTAAPAWNTIAGPVTESSDTLTFSGTIPSYTLVGGDIYGLVIFTVASGTPPPAPVPTPSPTPTPTPVGSLFASWTGINGFNESSVTASAVPGTGTPPPTVTGQTIAFAQLGQAVTVTLSESGFNGTFTGQLSGCSGDATIAGSTPNTYTVTNASTSNYTGCTATFFGLSTAGYIAFPITGPADLGGGVQ